MANHGVVRTDNMRATVFGGDLVSCRYAVSSTPTAIDNGNFCVPGAFETGAREVRTCSTPAANTAVAALVLIASEEVDKTEKYDNVAEFTNKAGAIARGYKLHTGDVFSLTIDAFDKASAVTPTVGTSILEAQAGVKGKMVNSATENSVKIADLIAIETQGTTTWYVFRVA